jgi:hypothetical protein
MKVMKYLLTATLSIMVISFGQQTHAQAKGYFLRQWDNLIDITNVSFANSNFRYAKDKVPDVAIQNEWKGIAWKGEKVNTQILLWSKQSVPKVTYSVSDLVNSKGGIIDTKNISVSFIRYVWTDGYFGNGCYRRNTHELDSSLVADVLDTVSIISMKENTVQPVWLSIQVPQNIPSGLYNGKILINAGKIFSLKVTLRVSEHILPLPAQWKFDLDLWQYPVTIAKAHGVPLWSEEHFKAIRPYYAKLAGAGQKCITISMIEGGNQSREVSPAMIKWILKKDGTWSYDYGLFDKYVSFVMGCGITNRINCYTMVPWNMEFTYFDEQTGKDASFTAETNSSTYKTFWQNMLKDFTRHLKQKGWFANTSIAMDERKLPDMLAVIKIIREIDTDWKISLAGAYHHELVNEINDYSIFKSSVFTQDDLKYRNAKGMSSTFYTSCEGEKPNMFTFSPPAESVWMGWYAASRGFSGYLRWAYNLWNENPLVDSRGGFPAGDFFQIYPGPRSSVRFEKLIEGIQDFEKIRIIRDEYIRKGEPEKLMKLNTILASFESELLDLKSADEMVTEAKKVLSRY